MAGAVLTQGTNWRNVERAIGQLKAAQALSARKLVNLRVWRLQRLIRSAGYFRQKAKRLQGLSRWYLSTYGANVKRMFQTDTQTLRSALLQLPGIGPETADSILLYAGHRAVFVIDAYTRRIFRRHQLIDGQESYETIQRFVMDHLPEDPQLFNEFHALLVAVGKRYCRRHDPDCAHCPLGEFPRRLEEIADG